MICKFCSLEDPTLTLSDSIQLCAQCYNRVADGQEFRKDDFVQITVKQLEDLANAHTNY